MTSWREFGSADETGDGSVITLILAPLIALQAYSAAAVSIHNS